MWEFMRLSSPMCTKRGGAHCNMHDFGAADCTVGSRRLRRSVAGMATSSLSYTIRHGGDTPEWSTARGDSLRASRPGAGSIPFSFRMLAIVPRPT